MVKLDANDVTLAEYIDEESPDVRGPWKIQDSGSVDWALRRKAECEQEIAEVRAQGNAAIAAIEGRVSVLTQKAERGIQFFEVKLLEWAEANRDKLGQGKKKSRDFVHGRIGTRSKGGKLVVTDKTALETWLRSQPPERGLCRIKVEANMKAVQDLFATHGEIPPGCDVDPERDEIYIQAEAVTKAITKGE
jgi:phage host-nuclease inhibitor protein Gam